MEYDRVSLEDWQKQQPLSVLQLDTADRVVLRVAGKMLLNLHFHDKISTTPSLEYRFLWGNGWWNTDTESNIDVDDDSGNLGAWIKI